LGNRRNPNGCPVKATFFVSLNYTNHSLVTDTYIEGNEIADHTMSESGQILVNLHGKAARTDAIICVQHTSEMRRK